MDKITDQIFIGNSSEAADPKLKESGITAILNVAHDLNRSWYDGILSLKVGLTDGPCPENKISLKIAVSVISQVIDAGYILFVHCHNGVNRSPYVVANYFAWRKGTNWKDEFEMMKVARSGIFTKPWMSDL